MSRFDCTTYNTSPERVSDQLCKPVIPKWKILGGGKPEYYKSMGEPQKKRGGSNFEISVGGSKNRGEGDTIFDSNLVGGNLGGNYGV